MIGQLKVGDGQIATTSEHYDAAYQMLAICSRGTLMLGEHSDSDLSLLEIHSLREVARIIKHNYLQLLVDTNYLLEWGCSCYDALMGKYEVVDPMHELEVTLEILRAPSWLFRSCNFNWMRLLWS